MGNYRFKLSDMMPNAWFYKLKDMNKTRNQHKKLQSSKKNNTSSLSPSNSSLSSSVVAASNDHQSKITNQPHMSDQRKSYYFTRDLTNSHPNSPTNTIVSDKQFPTEPPRKSSRRRRSTKKSRPPSRLVSTSISAGCSCRATLESVWAKPPDPAADESADSPLDQMSSSDHYSVIPEYGSDRTLTTDTTFDGMLSWTNSCKCRMENDIVIDIDDDNKTLNHLPPIITTTKKQDQPTKIQRTSAEFSERNAYGSLSVKVVKEDFVSATKTTTSPIRRFSSSPGVKLRTNSPRIANRRIQSGRKSVPANSRRSVSESFAVVKSSKDPRRDFRESMVEMIVENNLKASKDLEELLACYLSLNSDEYHDVIINVFKQIWFDYVHVRLK